MNLMLAIAVMLAGGLGAALRLVVGSWVGALPWGILAANTMSGSGDAIRLEGVTWYERDAAGIITARTRSLPSASTATASTSAESIPPDSPNKVDGKPFLPM